MSWIHVEIAPVWQQIRSLRHFVREFCLGAQMAIVAADQVAMTTSELLENAIKYASQGWLRYDLRLLADQVEVCVVNAASPEQRAALRGCLDDVLKDDPLDSYVRCLEQQHHTGTSRAGLARIRYEAAAELSLREDGDEVCLTARISLG